MRTRKIKYSEKSLNIILSLGIPHSIKNNYIHVDVTVGDLKALISLIEGEG